MGPLFHNLQTYLCSLNLGWATTVSMLMWTRVCLRLSHCFLIHSQLKGYVRLVATGNINDLVLDEPPSRQGWATVQMPTGPPCSLTLYGWTLTATAHGRRSLVAKRMKIIWHNFWRTNERGISVLCQHGANVKFNSVTGINMLSSHLVCQRYCEITSYLHI